jgi:hypothetical protein
MSVVELALVVTLLSIVMASTFAALISQQNTSATVDLRLENLGEARPIMDTTSRDLRTAVRPNTTSSPFVLAAANEAVFFANLETTNGPKRVRIYVDANKRVVEEVVVPSGIAPNLTYTSAPAVRMVGSYFANAPTQPLFTYLDETGNPLGPTPLSADDLLRINSVRIELAIRKATSFEVPATTVRTTVRLPNVDYQPYEGS